MDRNDLNVLEWLRVIENTPSRRTNGCYAVCRETKKRTKTIGI